MHTKIIEVTNYGEGRGGMNWGKFLVGRFDSEWEHPSEVNADSRLLGSCGWTDEHLLVLDLQTGEGAIFRHGGKASYDLNKHRIWVCPMFEPFLNWLYKQDVGDLDALPNVVAFTESEAPSALVGYRRGQP